jgi:2-dehydro-3-deoxyphosphogluconate aldolase / (4S)-4-hydroxy-2-oxoglutarate aldolase
MNTYDFIAANKVVVIVRKMYGEDLLNLSRALFAGGVRLMEVTFDQQDPLCAEKTAEAIKMLIAHHDDKMMFGAGTVLSVKQVDAACAAGARYIISPNFKAAVVEHTKKRGLVSIPGCMTPTEIIDAHDCGADFIKLFPATTLGFKYIKDILAPISHVKLVATGGVNEENFGEYLALGFAGAGISGRLTDRKLIAEGNWDELTSRAQVFSDIAKK